MAPYFEPDLIRALEEFGNVLSPRLAEREACCFGRADAVEQLQRRLDHPTSNSFILVGTSGCGKTAVLHEVFRRVAVRDARPWLVLETSSALMLAGTMYRGELESRVKRMLDATQRSRGVVLYVSDIYHLVGAGRTVDSDQNVAAIMSPYIQSGNLVLVGECTPELFQAGIEPHPSFARLFTVYRLEEQPESVVREVVQSVARQRAESIAAEHGFELSISGEVLRAVQDLGRLYFPGTAAPGNAIKLLDHVLSAKANAVEASEPEATSVEVAHQDVITALESFTGIPRLLLDDASPIDLGDVRTFFSSRVIGQDDAVDAVVDLITLIKAGVTDPKKPIGVFFFVGPTGVGKTELAKALAEFIFGSPDRMIRFDMSEFKDYHSFEKLIGSPRSDNKQVAAGSLLTRVRQQPFSVILLDEIEKAHPNIFDLLLQLFDDGRLSDPQGRSTNFTQTVVVMTSNLGSDLSRTGSAFGFHPEKPDLEAEVLAEMQRFFRPEFLNRIGRIVVFRTLGRESMRQLAQRELEQVLQRGGITRRGMKVDVDPGVIELLVKEGFSPTYGARPLKRAVERLVLLPVAREIVGMPASARGVLLRLVPAGERIVVRLVRDSEHPRSEPPEVRRVLVIHPVHGKRIKMTPEEIDHQLADLQHDLGVLDEAIEDSGLRQRKSELIERSGQADFWNDRDAAREAMGQIHRIERLLSTQATLQQQVGRLEEMLHNSRSRQRPELLTQAASRLHDVRRHLALVRYAMQSAGSADQCDAFVALTAIDPPRDADDFVGRLADMYTNWARGKGFDVTLFHEELTNSRSTGAVIFRISGLLVYGALAREEGIHEAVYGRTADTGRYSRFVKVRVLPLVETPEQSLPDGEISLVQRFSRGPGLRCPRYRSCVTLTHQPTLVTVVGRSDLAVAEGVAVGKQFLQAEVHRLRATALLKADAGRTMQEEVVRRYRLQPTQSARDLRTGISTRNLHGLWNGDLDEFLIAAMAQAHPPAALPAPLPELASPGGAS